MRKSFAERHRLGRPGLLTSTLLLLCSAMIVVFIRGGQSLAAAEIRGTVTFSDNEKGDLLEQLASGIRLDFGDTFNVRTFGAKGDWEHDDQPAIDAAITNAWKSVLQQFDTVRPYVDSDREAAAHVSAIVLFPPGTYRHSGTIIKPPGISIIGTYQRSHLLHQSVPRGSPGTNSFRIKDEVYQDLNGKTVQILCLGEAMYGKHVIDSADDAVIGIHTESRGNNVAIYVAGRPENFRVKDCVLKGFPAGVFEQSSVGIAFHRLTGDLGVDWIQGVPFVTGWNTDGSVSGCFFELFEYGVYGAVGQSMAITGNTFESCRVGVRALTGYGITISDNRFHAFGHFTENVQRPKSFADTAVAVAGSELMIQGNHIMGYPKGFLLSGRDHLVTGNYFKLTSTNHVDTGYFLEIADPSKPMPNRPRGNGGILPGKAMGGEWLGYWNYIVTGNFITWPVRDRYYLVDPKRDPFKVPPGFQTTIKDNITSFQK